MKRLKLPLALLMALLLLAAPTSIGWAGDVKPTDTTVQPPADSGHPWDDEAQEGSTDPGGNTGNTGGPTAVTTAPIVLRTPMIVSPLGSKWFGSTLQYYWQSTIQPWYFAKLKSLTFWR